MKIEWLLSVRYFQRHKKQSLGAVLAIAVFCTAILTSLLLCQSILYTNSQNAYAEYGKDASEIFFADQDKVTEQKQTLAADGCGIITMEGAVSDVLTGGDNPVGIGYFDANALRLRSIRLVEGNFPIKPNEVAIEENAYYALGLSASVGDTVTLPVTVGAETRSRQYVLTGILADYVQRWQYNMNQLYSLPALKNSAVGLPAKIVIPGILTGEISEVQAVHVLSPSANPSFDVGGVPLANYWMSSGQEYQQGSNRVIIFVTGILVLFFSILILYGIFGIAQITLKDRARFLSLIRCIGMTRKQIIRIFLLQALLLAAFANGLGILLSLAALPLIVGFASLFGTSILMHFDFLPFLVSTATGSTAILVLFYRQTKKLFQSKIFENGTYGAGAKRKKAHGKHPNKPYWEKMNRNSLSGSRQITTLLVSMCIGCFLFGLFSAEFTAASHYLQVMQGNAGLDYSIQVKGGTGNDATLDTTVPRGMGVSEKNLQTLEQTPGIKVQSAFMENMAMDFLLVKNSETNAFLKQLAETRFFGYNDKLEQEITRKFPQQAGYGEDETVVDYPIANIDLATLKNLSSFITQGRIEEEQFLAGKEIAVQGGGLQLGDVVTVTYPVFSEQPTQSNPHPQAQIHNFTATVGAILSVDESRLVNPQIFSYDDCVLFSSEAVQQADPTARYDNVYLTKTSEDPAVLQNAKKVIRTVVAQTNNVYLTDVSEYAKLWRETVNSQKWPVYVAVFALLLIMMLAYAITVRMKLKTNLHSYALLRSIGMSNRQLAKNILLEAMRGSAWGLVFGITVALAFCTFISMYSPWVPSLQIYGCLLLLAALGGSAVILAVTALACIAPIRWITRQPIVESLNQIEF